jgi:DNA-binding CsgD family transcriptional regulator
VGEVVQSTGCSSDVSDLVGREFELDRVSVALKKAERGVSSVLVFEAGLGMGKTALLDAVASKAEKRGFEVFRAAASEYDRDVVRQVLGAASPDDSGNGATTARLANFVDRHAPLCLVLDDLHHADFSSLRALNHLVSRVRGQHLVVVAARLAGAPSAEPLLLAGLDIYADRMTLRAFGPGEIAELAGTSVEDGADALAEATAGVPLLVRHVLAGRTAAELGMVLLARLHRQSARLARLARTIAVLRSTEPELVAVVMDSEIPAVADGVRQLEGMGLLRGSDFASSLVGTAVVDVVSHSDREEMHTRATWHLHRSNACYELVARHLVQTSGRFGSWAAEDLRRAADVALSDEDSATAVAYLTRALREEMSPRLRRDLLDRLSQVEIYLDPRQAEIHLIEALDHVDDPDSIVAIASRLAQVLYLDARYHEAKNVLSRAIDMIGDPERSAPLQIALRVSAPSMGDDDTIGTSRDDALWECEGNRERAALIANFSCTTGNNLAQGRKAALFALSGGVQAVLHDPQRLLTSIDSLLRVDELDVALRCCDDVVADADSAGLVLLGLLGRTLRSRVHRHLGRIPEARQDAVDAVTTAHRIGVPVKQFTFVYATEALVHALIGAGELEAAREAAERIGLVGSLPRTWHHACFLHARGVLRMRSGDAEGALADQLECGRRLTSWSGGNPPSRSWRSNAALACLKLGRSSEAREFALDGLELARRECVPSTTARALLTVAKVSGGSAAVPWLMEAEKLLRESPARLLHAEVLLELGANRWHHGQRDLARQDLSQVRSIAEQCGAISVLASLAELPEEAVRRSEVLPRSSMSAVLTAHELRVATLVVNGGSNDEIARQLGVTRRAVEFHLTNIYRKLGVRRRTQLPAALAEWGL